MWAGDIAAAVGLKNVTTGDTICDSQAPDRARGDELPRAGDRGLDRAQDQGRPGEARHGAGQADAGRPDVPRPHRPGHRPDPDLGHGRAAPGDHHRPPGARVQRRRQRRQAAGGLQGNGHRTRPRARAGSSARPAAAASTATPRSACARPREGEFIFNNKIVGGSIPKEFIKPIEQGIKEALENGPLAGYPMTGVEVDLYDGSYHDVDSSEIAFKIAGSMAFQDACKKARPVLLEPIMAVEVVTPEEYMGEVIGDITSRRGRIQNMEARGNAQVITCKVPLSEMFGYATDLRSISRRGAPTTPCSSRPTSRRPRASAKKSSPRPPADRQASIDRNQERAGGETMGKEKFERIEAARERRDDRSRGPWQDDADGGDHEGAGGQGAGRSSCAFDQIDKAPERARSAASRSRRRTWSTRRRTATTRTWTARVTPTTSRT